MRKASGGNGESCVTPAQKQAAQALEQS